MYIQGLVQAEIFSFHFLQVGTDNIEGIDREEYDDDHSIEGEMCVEDAFVPFAVLVMTMAYLCCYAESGDSAQGAINTNLNSSILEEPVAGMSRQL